MDTNLIHTTAKILSNTPFPAVKEAATLVDKIVSQIDKAKGNEEYLEYFKTRIKAHQEILDKSPSQNQAAYTNYVKILKEILEYVKEVKNPGPFSHQFMKKIAQFMKAEDVSVYLK